MNHNILLSTRSFVFYLWIGVAGFLAALAFTALNVNTAHAASPYSWEKSGDFAWEKRVTTTGQWNGLNEGTRKFLESQGIRCEGAVCRPSGDKPIPEELDLSGRDLRNLTFKDLHVQNLKTNATDLSNTKFENFKMDGEWKALQLIAKNLVIEGFGQTGDFGNFGRFNTEWKQVNAEGMHLSRLQLVDTFFDRVKASGSQITDSMVSNESMHEFVNGAVTHFPANIIVETYRNFGENHQVEGLLPPGKYEGLNLEGSHLNGSLKNVEFVDSNLKNIEVSIGERPQGARWDRAWENVTIKEGSLDNAKFDLLNSHNLKINTGHQDNVEINSREITSNLQVKGIANDFKLRGNYENADLRDLRSTNIVREVNLGNLPHVFTQEQLSLMSSEATFLDTSGSRQKNVLLPKNISGSKISNTEFIDTKLPDGLKARNVEAIGTQFRADAGNTVGRGTDFSRSQLKEVDFNGQKLQDTNFSGARLDGVRLENVSLVGSTVFDQAKVTNLDAASAKLDNGSHLSALGTIWESIKKFFGFGSNSTMDLARSTIEGQLDLSGMSTAQLAKVNWSGIRFAPNSEIIYKDVNTLVDSLPRLLGQHSTNTIQNLKIAAIDERGETVYVIKDGQPLSEIAGRLTELHSSRTVAEHIAQNAKAALDATNPATEKVRLAQAQVDAAEHQVRQKTDDPRLMDLEKTWNRLDLDHEIAQGKYEHYVKTQETALTRTENYIKEAVPEHLAGTRGQLDKLIEAVVDLRLKADAEDEASKAKLERAEARVTRYMRAVSTFENKELRDLKETYEELLLDKKKGWPSDLKTHANELAEKKTLAESRLEKYSKTYNENLEKAKQVLTKKLEELAREVESHSKLMEEAKFLSETKEMADGIHEKNVRSEHQEVVSESDKNYETALSEANRQVEELKSQAEIARQDVARGEATRETARLRAEEANKAYEALKAESLKLAEAKRSHESQIKQARTELKAENPKLNEQIATLEKEVSARERLLNNEFSEQELESSALARETKTQLKEYEAELKDAQKRQSELQEKFDTAKKNYDAANEKLAEIDSKLDGAKGRMEVRKGSLSHVEETLREAKTRVTDAEAKLTAVQSQVSDMISAREQEKPLPKDNPFIKSAVERANQEAAKAEEDRKSKEAADKARNEYLKSLEKEKERQEQERQKQERERIRQEQERNRQEQERNRQEQERIRQEQERQTRERVKTR